MNWDDEIERLIKSDFFFKMGETEQIDHVIFIKNVNEAFINPTEEAFENLYKKMNWLPSSLSDRAKLYSKRQERWIKTCLYPERMIFQMLLKWEWPLLLDNI